MQNGPSLRACFLEPQHTRFRIVAASSRWKLAPAFHRVLGTPFRIVAGKLAIAKLGFSSRKHAVSHCGGQARDRETWLHTDACKLDLVFETGWRAVRRREHGGAPGIITSRTRKPAWVLRSGRGNILVRVLSDRRRRSCARPSTSAPLWRRGHAAKASACRRAAGVFNW